jgi:hypothetical protein
MEAARNAVALSTNLTAAPARRRLAGAAQLK